MHVGNKTEEIGKRVESGESMEDLAVEFGVSVRSIEKRSLSYQRSKGNYYQKSKEERKKSNKSSQLNWTAERISIGFERFIQEHGRLPTASEIDDYPYLPSSRSIQRSHGGLPALRKKLGYDQSNFSKGEYRSKIATRINKDGLDAEDRLEQILVSKFKEPFVHSQRGYSGKKNSFDFLVYSYGKTFGIDVFVSNSKANIQKTINMKIKKYLNAPKHIQIYFVVMPTAEVLEDMTIITKNMAYKSSMKSLKVLFIDEFQKEIEKMEHLEVEGVWQSYYEQEV